MKTICIFFALLFASLSSASAETEACGIRQIQITGNLSAGLSAIDAARLNMRSIANADLLFVPTPESEIIEGVMLRFTRTSDRSWRVDAGSVKRSDKSQLPEQFHGPLAFLNEPFQGSSDDFSAYIPVDAESERKLQLRFTLDGLHSDEAASALRVETVSAGLQDCPLFGKVLLTEDDAKKPEFRPRVLNEKGEDITDEVSVATGGVPILKSAHLTNE